MTENHFLSYDSFYNNISKTNHQINDLNISINSSLDYDILPSFISYMNNEHDENNNNVRNTIEEEVMEICSAANTNHNHSHSNPKAMLDMPSPNNLTIEQRNGNISTTFNENPSTSSAIANRCQLSTTTLPFVQIHTCPVELSIINDFCPVYCQNNTTNNKEDIKFEPIKSENNDTAITKEPHLTRTQRITSITEALHVDNSSLHQSEHNIAKSYCDDYPKTHVFKCDHCPFISLTDLDKQEHTARTHLASISNNNEQSLQLNCSNAQRNQPLHHQRLDCPGCSNVFYTRKTLEIHLKFDHLMLDDHLTKFMDALNIKTNQCAKKATEKQNSISNDAIKLSSNDNIRKRSGIYLKNFECLKEPRKAILNCDDKNNMNDIDDKNCANKTSENELLDGTLPKRPFTIISTFPKQQKISIKNVNALREPALLQQDNQIQSNIFTESNQYSAQDKSDLSVSKNASNFIGTNRVQPNFDYKRLPNIIPSASCSSKQTAESIIYSKTLLNKELNNIENFDDAITSTHKPKIYLKTGKNFNLTPTSVLDTPILDNDVHNNKKILPLTTNTPDASLGYLSCLLESNANESMNCATVNNSLLTNNNGSSNTTENGEINVYVNSCHNGVGGLPIINGANTTYLLNTTAFNSTNADGCTTTTITTTSTDCLQENKTCNSSELILIPRSSTPVVNTTQALCVNNNSNSKCIVLPLTDNSKRLSSQLPSQEPKKTLHLRTVDELNLMNKKEVQNLIAPNLENNNGTLPINSSVKNTNFDMDKFHILSDNSFYSNENLKFQDLDTQMICEWTDVLTNDIDYIIAECENLTPEDMSQNMENTSTGDMSTLINTKNILTKINDVCSVLKVINYEEQPSTLEQDNCRQNDISNSEYLLQNHLNVINKVNNNSNDKKDIMMNPDENVNNIVTREDSEIINGNNTRPQPITLNALNLIDSSVHSSDNGNPIQTINVLHSTDDVHSFSNFSLANVSNIELPKTQISSINTATEKLNTSVSQPVESNLHNVVPLSENFAKMSMENNKKRIYIANNLVHHKQNSSKNDVSQPLGISVRGRPFGSNRAAGNVTSKSNNRIKKKIDIVTNSNSSTEIYSKCTIKNCTFRFKMNETLKYHMKCHDSQDNSRLIICPECKSKEFQNWNTLHTHLWRAHSVDMELYSCELCSFKTPVYSRLINTHAKIHYDDRNYKCDQCDKAFKNSKQLKNHRSWHRTRSQILEKKIVKTPLVDDKNSSKEYFLHRCLHCGTVFSHLKSLRAHCCTRDRNSILKCKICQKTVSSKSSLTLHMNSKHNDSSSQRFKCLSCDYGTNDHNTFRRHRMSHSNSKMYNCSYCGYKCIQSFAYQKHVRVNHPEHLDSLIYRCVRCTYFTVNKILWLRHLAKHVEPTTHCVENTHP